MELRTHTTSRLWGEPDPRFNVTFHWAEVDGVIECVGVDVRAFYERRRSGKKVATPVHRDGPAPVTTSVLRSLPLASLIEQELRALVAQARWASRSRHSPAAPDDRRELSDIAEKATDATRDRYAAVAEVYAAARATGLPPTKAVMEHFGVGKSTASSWVSRARDRGLLPPTTRGRPGPVTDPRRRRAGGSRK